MGQPSSQNSDGAPQVATAHPACEVHLLGCTAICARCGDFACPSCLREIQGQGYCPVCVAGGHVVDYVGAFRAKRWGRRDGWAWMVGLGAGLGMLVLLGYMGEVTRTVSGGSPAIPLRRLLPGLLLQVGWVFASIVFFAGIRWSRPLLLGLGVVDLVLALTVLPTPVVLSGFRLLIIGLILMDPGNRLFFRMEVGERALRRMYLAATNLAARLSVVLGLLGLVTFGVCGVIGLVLAIQGLRRVDLQAVPPVGGTGYAVTGLCISGCSVLIGGVLLVGMLG